MGCLLVLFHCYYVVAWDCSCRQSHRLCLAPCPSARPHRQMIPLLAFEQAASEHQP